MKKMSRDKRGKIGSFEREQIRIKLSSRRNERDRPDIYCLNRLSVIIVTK